MTKPTTTITFTVDDPGPEISDADFKAWIEWELHLREKLGPNPLMHILLLPNSGTLKVVRAGKTI